MNDDEVEVEPEEERVKSSPAAKRRIREKLAKEVEAYFARGGQATKVPKGETAYEFVSVYSRKQNKEQRKRALNSGH